MIRPPPIPTLTDTLFPYTTLCRAGRLAAAGLGSLVTSDSAGTADYHMCEPPYDPARRLGSLRGYDLEPLRARQVAPGDFADFDLILAMDRGHLRQLRALQPPG